MMTEVEGRDGDEVLHHCMEGMERWRGVVIHFDGMYSFFVWSWVLKWLVQDMQSNDALRSSLAVVVQITRNKDLCAPPPDVAPLHILPRSRYLLGLRFSEDDLFLI